MPGPEGDLSSDLQNVLSKFTQIKEHVYEGQEKRQLLEKKLNKTEQDLQKYMASEKNEKARLTDSRKLLSIQQETINKLLIVKTENKQLSEKVQQLEERLVEQNNDFEREISLWKQKLERTCQEHARRLEEQRCALQTQSSKIHNELSQSQKKIQALEGGLKKQTEQNEVKVKTMEAELSRLRLENKYLSANAASSAAFYNKKLEELERESQQHSKWPIIPHLIVNAVRNTSEYPPPRKRKLFNKSSLNVMVCNDKNTISQPEMTDSTNK